MQKRASHDRDHKGGGCVYVHLNVYVCLTCTSEDSAPHLISILNECVLFLSDASCPPRAPISMMQSTCVSMRSSNTHTHGVFKSQL